MVPVVEADLRLLKVKIRSVVWDPLEFCETVFGESPERLDTVDVVVPESELTFLVSDSEVFS